MTLAIFQYKFFSRYNQLIYSCKVRFILAMIKKSVNKIHHKMLKIMLEHIAFRSCCTACVICEKNKWVSYTKNICVLDRELFVSVLSYGFSYGWMGLWIAQMQQFFVDGIFDKKRYKRSYEAQISKRLKLSVQICSLLSNKFETKANLNPQETKQII